MAAVIHLMVGFLLFCACVAVAIRMWRVLLPIAALALLFGGAVALDANHRAEIAKAQQAAAEAAQTQRLCEQERRAGTEGARILAAFLGCDD